MAETPKRSRDFFHFLENAHSIEAGHRDGGGFVFADKGDKRGRPVLRLGDGQGAMVIFVGGSSGGTFNFHADRITDFVRQSTPFLRLFFLFLRLTDARKVYLEKVISHSFSTSYGSRGEPML